jgi:adenine-specific DNA-methyltransferase
MSIKIVHSQDYIQGSNHASVQLCLADAYELVSSLPSRSIDLFLSSPPYFVGKEYDRSRSLRDFEAEIKRLAPEVIRVLKPGGSMCWQVGNHVSNGKSIPLDAVVIALLRTKKRVVLRNRIIWTFGHGTHSNSRFSGRHESIVWFTKGDNYYFDLDSVRVRQKYPGKRHYKGPRKGEWSGNPNGKNPGDVWDIPNVKAKHVEKTGHPCQFPVALAKRLIQALSPRGGTVLDPYLGSGTTAAASALLGRNFLGGDIERRYLTIARRRLRDLESGEIKVRIDHPVRSPLPSEAVSQTPPHFRFTEKADRYG